MEFRTIRAPDGVPWFEMVYDDAGVERVGILGPKAVFDLLQLATSVVGPLGAVKADKVLLGMAPHDSETVRLGVRSALLGDVFFDLPLTELAALSQVADEALKRIQAEGEA